jgi:hypothetical protein
MPANAAIHDPVLAHEVVALLESAVPATASMPGVDGCEVNSDYGYGRHPFATASVLPPLALDARLPDAALQNGIGENCWGVLGGNGIGANISRLYGGRWLP